MFSVPGAKFVKILEQVKTLDCVSSFHYLLSNSPKHSPRFSPGYEDRGDMFYFLREDYSKKKELFFLYKS